MSDSVQCSMFNVLEEKKVNSGDTTVMMALPIETPGAVKALSREWTKKMAKEKKEERSEAEMIMEGFTKMTTAMAQDRQASNEKFDAVFKKLEDYKVLETRFKLYEKVLGLIALAILYGIIDKFF